MCNDVAPKIYPTVYGGPYEGHVNYSESWAGFEALNRARTARAKGYTFHLIRGREQ